MKKDKDFELSPEIKAGLEAEKKIEELNRQKREVTNFHAVENLDGKKLDYFEGYLTALSHQDRFKQIQHAIALYYIAKQQLYKERGFSNIVEYCKAIGMSKSAGYEWVKNVEEFGIKDFSTLVEKIGSNLTFFREIKALPEEVKNAVVKGEKIEINDKEYDLSKDGKGLREAVKALVHEINKNKLEKKTYDTHETWNAKIAKKDNEIKQLREQIDNQKIPLDDQEAIKRIQRLRIELRGTIRLLESADVKKYSDEVKEELLLTAQYAHDRGELFLGRMLDELKCDRPALEEAETSFLQTWDKDEA